VSVFDALLGEGEARTAGSRADRSVYATVRRYRQAALNVEKDRTFMNERINQSMVLLGIAFPNTNTIRLLYPARG
jgi:hypothetical protein